jgi:hypothetical protein
MVETKFQTSFIPKKSLMQEGTSTKSNVSLFLLLSILIFLVSLGIAGYVFLENQYLIAQINAAQQTITKNKSSFDTTTIDSIVELNSRINIAQTLLDNHVAVSPIFNFLQQATLKNVRFKDFNFSSDGKDANGNNVVSIKMSGQARDFETVASQADEFGLPAWSHIINQPKVSDLVLNADGSVSFSFSADIVPAYLSYLSTVQNNAPVTTQ